jgi:hypothetical protein
MLFETANHRRTAMLKSLWALVFWALLPTVASAAWQLPPGTEWKMPSDNCAESTVLYPGQLRGCYFGLPKEKAHSGIAFFRICHGLFREKEPFLVVMFKGEENEYLFDMNARGNLTPYRFYQEKKPTVDEIDPVDFFKRIRARKGDCRSETGANDT